MSTLKIKKTRKPGSGRKRKIGAITSQDYAEQLKQLEKRVMSVYMTPQQKEAIRKEKRSLCNRLSALRSREKKRAKLDQLENAVKRLQQEVEDLKRENQTLRSSTPNTEDLRQMVEFLTQENQALRQNSSSHTENTCDIPIRKRSRTSYTVSAQESSCSQQNTSPPPSSPSLSSNSLEAQRISTQVKPCTHNCGSAVSTQRSTHTSCVTGQYSHLLWEMPWKTLRSIFSTLWIVSKILMASKTRKEFLQSTTTYRQTQRSLRQIFWKTLVLKAQVEKFVGNDAVPGTSLQQQAFAKFDQICEKLLKKAFLNKEGCIRKLTSVHRHKRSPLIMIR